jgi:hypothetical protein
MGRKKKGGDLITPWLIDDEVNSFDMCFSFQTNVSRHSERAESAIK